MKSSVFAVVEVQGGFAVGVCRFGILGCRALREYGVHDTEAMALLVADALNWRYTRKFVRDVVRSTLPIPVRLLAVAMCAFLAACLGGVLEHDAGDVVTHHDARARDASRDVLEAVDAHVLEHDAGDVVTHHDARARDASRDVLEAVDAHVLEHDAGDVVTHHDAADAALLECFGYRDGGYVPILPPFPPIVDAGFEAGAACHGFGCWYACEAGPCLRASTCPLGVACLVAADAGNDFEDVPGTCVTP